MDRNKPGYMNFDDIADRLESGKLNAYDVVYTKDTHEVVFIKEDLSLIRMKCRLDVYPSVVVAEYYLNLNTDTYVGQIVGIEQGEWIGLYNVNYADNKFIVRKVGVDEYGQLTNKPQINGVTLEGNKTTEQLGINIPTKFSQLYDDIGYVTFDHLIENYYSKSQTYSKSEVDTALAGKADTNDIPTDLADLNDDSEHRTVSDEDIAKWDKKSNVVANPAETTGALTSIEIDGVGYTVSGSGGGAVNSVNGKTGNVVLNANDVGALPDDTPIPSHLSDLDEDSTHRVVTDAEKVAWNSKSNFSGSYRDLTDQPTIPSDLSQLNDDTTHRVVTDTEKNTWNNKSDFSGSYNDLTDQPTIPTVNNPTITIQKNGQSVDSFTLNQSGNKSINIVVPTKTSDLSNDSNFINSTVNNLANYYLKTQTYTQAEVDALIDAAINGRFRKVNALPVTGEPNIIYLVPKADPETSDACDEYIWQDNAWELIGSTSIDLSGYVTDEELTIALADYLTISVFSTTIANYYNKTEIGTLLDDKVDKVDGKGLSTYDYDAAAKAIVDSVTANLANKVDKVTGKGLSANDYDATAKSKVDALGTASTKNVPTSGNAGASEVVMGNDTRLSDARNAADVYAWAKADTKPSYTKSEVGLGNVDNTSDATKKSNFTGSIASGNTGFVTGGDAYTELNKKVDKVDGKVLSSNDYTDTDKGKVDTLGTASTKDIPTSGNASTSQVVMGSDTRLSDARPASDVSAWAKASTKPSYTKAEVGLGNVDNTSDADKPISTATQTALNNKVDKDGNKVLSTNDYTDEDKDKLDRISDEANKVESSETNGNIKIDTVETVVYDDAEIKNLVDTSSTETDYANPLSLETMNAQLAENTKVKIEPIQDLHGYDKPWVGGAGKNKWSLGNIEVGTASNQPLSLPVGTYTISTDTSKDITFRFNYENDSVLIANVSTNTPRTFTITDIVESVNFSCSQYTSGDSYEIQIEEGNRATSYEPYTNICPISGHDQIEILGCGKNLCDTSLTEIGKAWNGNNSSDRARLVLPCKSSTKYALSINGINGLDLIYVNNGTTIPLSEAGSNFTTSKIFTTQNNSNYIVIGFNKTNITQTDIDNLKLQLEESETVTSYSPYSKSNNLSIDLPSTVYGGVLDLESGELVVTYVKVNLGNYTYNKSGNNFYSSEIKNMKLEDTPQGQTYFCTNATCNGFKYYKNGNWNYDNAGFSLYYNSGYSDYRIFINGNSFIDYTGAQFKQYLSDNNIELCYELSTPLTIQLTPHQLSLLKAQNNLTTSQYTQIKVTYRNGVFATLEPVSEDNDGLMSRLDKVKLDSIADDATKTESSTTNGNIKINGTETQVYDDSEIKGELSTDTTTIEGNPLNFTTLSAQKSKSTIIDIEPIQDLHGYDKPWVGGAGKNLLPMTVDSIKADNTDETWSGNSYTTNGITYTILTDSDNNVIGINANGTASSTSGFAFYRNENGISNFVNMIINGCSNGSSSTYGIGFEAKGIRQETSDFTITSEYQSSKSIYIRVLQGIQITNVKFYPMIRLSTETDATFQPYTNIASISGRSEIGILGCGKNLLPMSVADIKANNTSGTWNDLVFTPNNETMTFTILVDTNNNVIGIKANGTPTSNRDFNLPIDAGQIPSGDYYFSGCADGGSSSKYYTFIWDITNSARAKKWNGTTNADYSTNSTQAYEVKIVDTSNYRYGIRIVANQQVSNIIFLPMICRADAINPAQFEPYTKSNDLTISLGQTVYGARHDVENGVLVVEKGYKLFDGTETWTILNYGHVATQISNMKSGTNQDGICSILETGNSSGQMQFGSGSNYIYIMNASGVYGIDTNEKAQAFTNGMQICYPLSTPITIQLTPNEISLLEGVNNISTDGDKITLTYRDGSVATLGDLTSAVDNLDSKIDESKILTDTVTGDKYILVVTNGVLSVQQISN